MKNYVKGLRHGLPIALGYLSVAFAFGIQATMEGLYPIQAVLISFFNVTSAGQLAGLQLMAAGGSLTELALTQLTINLRYALMSLSLSQKLDETMTTPHRLLLSFCNTDEVFVVASQQPGKVGKAYLPDQRPVHRLGAGHRAGSAGRRASAQERDGCAGHRHLRYVHRHRAAALPQIPAGALRGADRRRHELHV